MYDSVWQESLKSDDLPLLLSVIIILLCYLAEGYIVWLSLYVKSLILILMALSCVENVDMFHLK